MPNNNKITPPSPRYLTILCEFMAFFHEKTKPYPKDHEFSEDELAAITPDDIVKWMNMKAFGTCHPTPDSRLTSSFSSLEFLKKAISFYMPHRENWDQAAGQGGKKGRREGNPTKSLQVKALMQRVTALGGQRKKTKRDENNAASSSLLQDSGSAVANDGGGAHGLLRRMHAQNAAYIKILDTMGTTLRTFSRSVEQIKMSLETNNIALRHELISNEAAENNGDHAHKEEAFEAEDILTMNTEMKEDIAKYADVVEEFNNNNIVANTDIKILSGADGFCTFNCDKTGKQMDIPDGFSLPSCDLLRAWRHWITGFPDFKMRNDNDDIVDCPIRPLRFVNTRSLPQSLKKTFKDGWRPIMQSMQGDVTQMLETTPVFAMDENFIHNSYSMAMDALFAKAPGIFAESGSDKHSAWKVATWSRKIREQQLGQQQVRRCQGKEQGGGITVVSTIEEINKHSDGRSNMEEEECKHSSNTKQIKDMVIV